MKLRTLFALIFAAAALPSLRAQATYACQTLIYVFKNADVRDITANSATFSTSEETKSHWLVLPSPTTIHFGRNTLILELRGSKFAWSDKEATARKFTLISAPSLINSAGQKATIFIGGDTQYFEKQADGSFRLQMLPKDSPKSPHPESPHYALTLNARPSDGAKSGWAITCIPDIVAVGAREKIPGVDLDVGKPILATFKDELNFTAQSDEWTALLCSAPGGSDYGLLILIKVGPPPPLVPQR
jgi:hypothetical protein